METEDSVSSSDHCADVSIVVPTLNESEQIEEHLRFHQEHFEPREIIVADGGSDDGTVPLVKGMGERVRVIECDRAGRGHQLKAGVEAARSRWILMLHADTRLPRDFALETITEGDRRWGWFDCQFEDRRWRYQLLARAISLRSAVFSNPTGDQALWAHRALLEEAGDIPEVPIMEDLLLVKSLRRLESGRRIARPVTTSARKWRREGWLRVILLMWLFRLVHLFGGSPVWIYRRYYGHSPDDGE